MFCEVIIKIENPRYMSKERLAMLMSKISKNYVKLLQNVLKIWYNAYTINN